MDILQIGYISAICCQFSVIIYIYIFQMLTAQSPFFHATVKLIRGWGAGIIQISDAKHKTLHPTLSCPQADPTAVGHQPWVGGCGRDKAKEHIHQKHSSPNTLC